MRLTILAIFALSLNLASTASVSDSKKALWTSYKANSGLKFTDSSAETKAYATYSENLDYIEKWNSDPTKTSKLGENHLSHLSSDEMKKRVLLPAKSRIQTNTAVGSVQAPLAGVSLQSLVNYTDYFGPIKDQGNCGSCYAFTTAGVVEGQYYMKYRQRVTLSEQQILDCTSSRRGANQGCNGGDNLFSLAYIRQVGLCTDDAYSYTSSNDYYDVITGTCQRSTIASCNPIKIKNYGLVTATANELVMASYIQTYGPITVYIDASNRSFQLYKSGIYYEPLCSATITDHTVIAVGFGTDASGNDYWILRNSWGTTWGMNGYMLLARNKNGHCGVASSPYYAKF